MTSSAPRLAVLDDRELASRARNGCCHAFEELVRRYEERLYNFILRRTCDAADAEDIVQQAFLKAWQAIDRYDPRWKFSTWLHTIAIRVASTAAHQNSRRMTIVRSAAQLPRRSSLDPAKHCEVCETRENIWSLADKILDEEPRLALWLHYAEDMAPREIASVLGRTSLAVRVMLHRARKRLAEHAGDEPASGADAAHRLTSAAATFSSRLTDAACIKEVPS